MISLPPMKALRKLRHQRWRAKALSNPAYKKALLARHKVAMKRSAIKLKLEVMRAYGGGCSCCGESRLGFLTIDHAKGGGTKHRKLVLKSNGGGAFYRWLKANGFPKEYRAQCFQCNCGRAANGGVCPHKEKRPLYC